MADKRAYCLGVDARATRGPAGATVKRCACEVAQYMLFGRANAPAKTTEASVYAFNCQESQNDLHTDDQELGLNVVKLLRMEKTGAPGIIKTCSTQEWPVHFFFQAEDGIRDAQESRGLGDVYKRQVGLLAEGC